MDMNDCKYGPLNSNKNPPAQIEPTGLSYHVPLTKKGESLIVEHLFDVQLACIW